MRVAGAQGVNAGLDYVGGRDEVGFSDLQVHDVPALGLKLLGAGQDLKGGLGPEALGSRGKIHGSSRQAA